MSIVERGDKNIADTLEQVICRPDELTEAIAMYWKNGKRPLSSQLKKGLARAFLKFDEYQLSKWNRDGDIKLRDVMFMVHAKPKNEEQAATFKKLADKNFPTPNPWTYRLTGGQANK